MTNRFYHRRLIAAGLVFATVLKPSPVFSAPWISLPAQEGGASSEQPPVSLATVCKKKRQTGGAILGGLIGAAAGAAITGNVKGALVGGAAGAGGGYLIGKSWDKKACAESQKAVALALQTGRTQSWRSDDGSKGYTMAVDRTYIGSSTIERNMNTLDSRPLVLTDLAEANGVYRVNQAKVNLRDRPNFTKQSKIVESYKSGDKVRVLATTSAGDWMLVSGGGVLADGWIKANAMTVTGDDPIAFAQSDARPSRSTRVAMKSTCIDTHEVFEVKGSRSNSPATSYCHDAAGVFVSKDSGEVAKSG